MNQPNNMRPLRIWMCLELFSAVSQDKVMRLAISLAFFLGLISPLSAAEVIPPADQRFAAETTETPDFQRHVLPLLGRLGCNGRACHGSFQGQGGFRLSLFGYDFKSDHEALTAGDAPRVDAKNPLASLILQKPTMAIDHEGGERFKKGGWEYRLLKRWIEGGTPGYTSSGVELVSIELEPKEIVFDAPGKTQQLTIIANWSDGVKEDVTSLSRFRSNDESIAAVNLEGLVTSAGKGDTHVVAFYDNGTASVPVILPVTDLLGPKYPKVPTPTTIDELVVAKLRTLGIVPAEVATDAEFLRRLSLDMTGTLPQPEEVTAFLADTSSDKRARKIDELLERPSYAAWWTTKLCDLTGNSERNLPEGGEQGMRREKSAKWYDWIYRRIADNVPFDELVEGIIVATSREPGQSDEEFFAEMSSYFREKDPADFSSRRTMPYFWSNNRFTPPQPLRFSYAFLGIRLECAQCHKHPYDQWTKDDYDQFQVFFDGIKQNSGGGGLAKEMKQSLGLTQDADSGQYKGLFAKLVHEGKVVPWQEVTAPDWKKGRPRPRPNKDSPSGRVITPKLLGGEEVISQKYSDPREPLMEWLRQKDNPYFARALVNRVWASYFGVGIVEPPDDMNLANPPSNGPLLDYLAKEFIAHNYDLKWLHRHVTLSRTYQLSWRPNETNLLDERNFSHALVRRLPAELAYDAMAHATASSSTQKAMHTDLAAVRARAIGVSSGYSRNYDGSYALKLFGKPERAVSCDCERSNEPSLLQTVYMRNDSELLGLLDRKEGWIAEVAPKNDDTIKTRQDELIRDAYLRTVSRPPTEDEVTIGREHLAQAADPRTGIKDLLWALMNTKEFMLNH